METLLTWQHPRKDSNLHRPGSKPGAFPLDHAGVASPARFVLRASWLRTRPPGPLVRRGHRELGGTRTLFRQFAANVPRLRTSSGVRPAGVEPALPAWHAGVHPATPRPQTTFRHAVV